MLKKWLLCCSTRSATTRPSPPATLTQPTTPFGKVRLLSPQTSVLHIKHLFKRVVIIIITTRLSSSSDQRWKNKFWGKSLEILPTGMVNVTLPR